jgi:hypothetical protein
LKRTSTEKGFFIFYFLLWIFDKSSEPLHEKMNPTSCLFGSRFACAQTAIFFAKPCSKNAGEELIVLWIAARKQRFPASRNPNQNRAALWRIFSSNKSALAYRKTGFYANHDLSKQEVGFIFAWSDSELWSLFKYSKEIKNQKPIAVDVLFKA